MKNLATPHTKRGAKNTKAKKTNKNLVASIHWLRGTHQHPEYIMQVLDNMGVVYLETVEKGRYFYQGAHLYENGITLLINPMRDNMPACCLDVTGSACETITHEQLTHLANQLQRVTRIDVAIDNCPFTPAMLNAADLDGNMRTRARNSRYISTNRGAGGNTYYLGSRQSERLMRCYDSRGQTRIELELKGKTANSVAGLLACDAAFLDTCIGLLRDLVDYVDVSRDSNASRAPLLSWWAELVENVDRIRLEKAAVPVATFQRLDNWLRHQIATSLAVYEMIGGSVDSLLQHGTRRLKPRHKRLIRAYV